MKTTVWGDIFQRDVDEAGESEYRALVDTCRDGLASSFGWNPEHEGQEAELDPESANHLEGMLVEFLDGTVHALNRLRRRMKSK